MSDENTDQAMYLLYECASVWGISTSPLTFAYENSMYNVVAHTCSKKYLNKYMSNDFKTKVNKTKEKQYTSISYVLTNNKNNIRQRNEGCTL